MALVKCKECGEDVSNKAKTCPKCGAKVPQQTSLFTWIILVFVIFILYAVYQAPTTPSKTETTAESSSPNISDTTKREERPNPSWDTSTSKDEMTGVVSAYALSPIVFPSKQMEFPYHDVSSWLGVGCNGKNEWVFFGFSSAPNLTNDETKNGYSLIRTRIRWNDAVENVSLTQDWGEKFIHFSNSAAAISKIETSSTVLLELQWHGEQPAYFNYSLNGSSKAISEIRLKCSANKPK